MVISLSSKEDFEHYIDEHGGNFAAKEKAIVNCESNWNAKAVGDNGTSFGLVQIHLPAHPEISQRNAEDPKYALDYLIREYPLNPDQWSCAKLIEEGARHG